MYADVGFNENGGKRWKVAVNTGEMNRFSCLVLTDLLKPYIAVVSVINMH